MTSESDSDFAVRRKLKAEWRARVLQMAPEKAKSFGQKWEESLVAFPEEIKLLLFTDIRALLGTFISPFCALDSELAAIEADITAEGVTVALGADALLETNGYYLHSLKFAIGTQKWQTFLMNSRFMECNVLRAVFHNRTKVPVNLLNEVVPTDETLKEEYLLQTHEEFGNLMSTAAAGDVYNNSHWRMEALWQLAPEICRKMAVTRFRNFCPIHKAVLYGADKSDIDLDAFYETLLNTLPAAEFGYDPETVAAFEIHLDIGSCSLMSWAEINTRNSPHKEAILSALREALAL